MGTCDLAINTMVIRTCDQHKNLYIPLFFLTMFGPDYCVPRYYCCLPKYYSQTATTTLYHYQVLYSYLSLVAERKPQVGLYYTSFSVAVFAVAVSVETPIIV